MLLGVDYGRKRIGLALADTETKIASPLKVVGTIDEVIKTVKSEGVGKIIIGSPLTLSSEKAFMHKEASVFAEKIARLSGLPVELFDERLSSKAADALSGTAKTKAPRDALAAMLILQGWMDRNFKKSANQRI
jgi:putative Holliday junction resolvase